MPHPVTVYALFLILFYQVWTISPAPGLQVYYTTNKRKKSSSKTPKIPRLSQQNANAAHAPRSRPKPRKIQKIKQNAPERAGQALRHIPRDQPRRRRSAFFIKEKNFFRSSSNCTKKERPAPIPGKPENPPPIRSHPGRQKPESTTAQHGTRAPIPERSPRHHQRPQPEPTKAKRQNESREPIQPRPPSGQTQPAETIPAAIYPRNLCTTTGTTSRHARPEARQPAPENGTTQSQSRPATMYIYYYSFSYFLYFLHRRKD